MKYLYKFANVYTLKPSKVMAFLEGDSRAAVSVTDLTDGSSVSMALSQFHGHVEGLERMVWLDANHKIGILRSVWSNAKKNLFDLPEPVNLKVLEQAERDLSALGSDPIKAHVDPNHYKGYLVIDDVGLQWLEAMQYLPRFRDPTVFMAAVELQVRKYLDRCGKKDAELQELGKAHWYLSFMLAYAKNDYKPIRIKDIPAILAN